MGEHVADLIAPLHRFDVPGECDEVAPVAILAEHSDYGVDVARCQRRVELAEKGRNTSIRGCVEHRVLAINVARRFAGGGCVDGENCARFEPLASRDALWLTPHLRPPKEPVSTPLPYRNRRPRPFQGSKVQPVSEPSASKSK